MILVITSSYDRTVDYIIDKYSHVRFFRFNVDKFSTYRVAVGDSWFSISDDNKSIGSEECKSIYYRKPSPEDLTGIMADKYQRFVFSEVMSFVEGIVEYFSGRCLSKPSVMRVAGNKVFQACKAQECGFKIPSPYISNNLDCLNGSNGDVVVKPLSVGQIVGNDEKEFVQTNILDRSIDAAALKYSPVYFQEYIDKEYEVRVTVIDRSFFPVRIDSDNRVDWRKPNNKILYSEIRLPDHVRQCCEAYMDSVGSVFGCFDFIIKEDMWYFLEMNSNGQWAWLEFELGIDISGAIVRYLNG